MLYNPMWSKPSKEGFIVWLKEQDPNNEYNWQRASVCACAQYARAISRESDWYRYIGGHSDSDSIWKDLNILARDSNTFGDLLARAEHSLSDPSSLSN